MNKRQEQLELVNTALRELYERTKDLRSLEGIFLTQGTGNPLHAVARFSTHSREDLFTFFSAEWEVRQKYPHLPLHLEPVICDLLAGTVCEAIIPSGSRKVE